MNKIEIHSCPEMMDYIQEVGLLPLLNSGIPGYSAEDIVSEECRYVVFPDGGWDWPLWKWKGQIVAEGNCVYGKFFAGKAGFVSREWWPDLYNYRRSKSQEPEEGTIEDAILQTLHENGSMITRELRIACGFTGKNMRSKFDGYITRLQGACRIVTEDFIYPTDKHGREYGWGWALLSLPEQLLGREACRCDRTPEESYARLHDHLRTLLPQATERQIEKMISR